MSAGVATRLVRQSGSSFEYAFLALPADKRRGIHALYSFCRVVDDCVDEEDGDGDEGLREWTDEIGRCYAGHPWTELGRELADTVARFPIPRSALEDVVEGCRMDLTKRRYPTFADLRVYCLRVASAVGLASIEIFGYTHPRTKEYAVELGLALQLTNILRDVAPDAAQGRLYLPLEDLERFEVSENDLLEAARGAGAARSSGIETLLQFEVERARRHYETAASLLPAEDRRSMVSAEIMGAIYRTLLEEFVRRGCPVVGPRVRLTRPRKAWVALRTVPRVYWGR